MASIKRYILSKSAYTKDLSLTHRGLPTFDPIDNESPSSFAFGSVKAPVGTEGILSITLRCIKQHAGALELAFVLTHSNTDASAALQTYTQAQASYALSGSIDQVVSVAVPSALFSAITTIDEDDTIGFALDRIAPDAYLSDFRVTEIEIEFDATPDVDVATPRLSRDVTALSLWRDAIRDLQVDLIPLLDFERFELINRCVNVVASQFIGLMVNDYGTSSVVTESGGVISLAGLRIARTGAPIKFILHSSVAGVCSPKSMDEFLSFRPSDLEESDRVVYAYHGESFLIEKGDNIESLGTLKLYYPRVPTPVALDTDKIDLPDNAAMEIAMLKLKHTLAQRYKAPEENPREEMMRLAQKLFENYQLTATQEEIKQKVGALL